MMAIFRTLHSMSRERHSASKRIIVTGLIVLAAGCATGKKNMAPVNEQQKNEFIKGLEVVEQPALEPDWADFVKDHYPNWRQHYWVDRGQWGNRGYIMGKPTAEAEPVVETQITPLPPLTSAPPAIVEEAPPKIVQADKPIYYLSGPILPLSPTLCFTDGRLLVEFVPASSCCSWYSCASSCVRPNASSAKMSASLSGGSER